MTGNVLCGVHMVVPSVLTPVYTPPLLLSHGHCCWTQRPSCALFVPSPYYISRVWCVGVSINQNPMTVKNVLYMATRRRDDDMATKMWVAAQQWGHRFSQVQELQVSRPKSNFGFYQVSRARRSFFVTHAFLSCLNVVFLT